jgi:hypothetical protein
VKHIIIVPVIRAGLGAALVLAAMLSMSCSPDPLDDCLAAVQAMANEIKAAERAGVPPGCQEELDSWCDCYSASLEQAPWGQYGPICPCLAVMKVVPSCPPWQDVLDYCNGACLQSFMYYGSEAQKKAANEACQSSTRKKHIGMQI